FGVLRYGRPRWAAAVWPAPVGSSPATSSDTRTAVRKRSWGRDTEVRKVNRDTPSGCRGLRLRMVLRGLVQHPGEVLGPLVALGLLSAEVAEALPVAPADVTAHDHLGVERQLSVADAAKELSWAVVEHASFGRHELRVLLGIHVLGLPQIGAVGVGGLPVQPVELVAREERLVPLGLVPCVLPEPGGSDHGGREGQGNTGSEDGGRELHRSTTLSQSGCAA